MLKSFYSKTYKYSPIKIELKLFLQDSKNKIL